MEKRFASENFPPEIQRKADQMNLEESCIPPYSVPQPDSSSADDFVRQERPWLRRAFAEHIYGAIPPRCKELEFRTVLEKSGVFGGLATQREIVIRCAQNGQERLLNLLLFIPSQRNGQRVPVFFGMNFRGNHAGTTEPSVRYTIAKRYPTLNNSPRTTDARATEAERGIEAQRWCHEKLLRQGYATATICYWDLYPDHPYGFADSILPLFFDEATFNSPERPCGAISAWAWGYQRAMDCLQQQPELLTDKIYIHGLSRLGKVALWTSANDTRPALTVSCCSGCLGAKLSRRYMGEDFSWVDLWNPHWTVPAFRKYIGRDWEIPVEQNQLMGCIAPRRLLVLSASLDAYADPHGEFLCCAKASPFYRLFGGTGLSFETMPQPGELLGDGEIGYYCQNGEHNFYPEGWDAILKFLKR